MNDVEHVGEFLELCPEDMERMNLEDGEIVRVSSRRGAVESPVRTDARLRPGLGFTLGTALKSWFATG